MSFSEKISDEVKKKLTGITSPIDNPLVWNIAIKRSSAFAGATTNAHGDNDGTSDPYTLFTVTGDVVIKAIWGIVNTSLTGATATIEVGVTGNTAALLAQETATELDAGGVYVSATQAVGAAPVAASGAIIAIADGLDIIETVATADVTAGQIDYYVIWAAVEPEASVVPA